MKVLFCKLCFLGKFIVPEGTGIGVGAETLSNSVFFFFSVAQGSTIVRVVGQNGLWDEGDGSCTLASDKGVSIFHVDIIGNKFWEQVGLFNGKE